jgi:hypothetical protein
MRLVARPSVWRFGPTKTRDSIGAVRIRAPGDKRDFNHAEAASVPFALMGTNLLGRLLFSDVLELCPIRVCKLGRHDPCPVRAHSLAWPCNNWRASLAP